MNLKTYFLAAIGGIALGAGAAWATLNIDPQDAGDPTNIGEMMCINNSIESHVYVEFHNYCVEILPELDLETAQERAASYGLCMAAHYSNLHDAIMDGEL